MHIAARLNSLEICKLLLAHNANAKTRDQVLSHHIQRERDIFLIFLFQAGLAPIHYSSGRGYIEVTEELIPVVGVNYGDKVFFHFLWKKRFFFSNIFLNLVECTPFVLCNLQ